MFTRWNLPKKGLKKGVETIKSFHPTKSKFEGKSATERQIGASISRIKQESFEFQEGVKKAIKKMKKIKEID